MKHYFTFSLQKVLTVNNLLTLEYLNLPCTFAHPEEVHDFYEFAYVDYGKVICNSKGKDSVLQQGEFYLIQPNENHYYTTGRDTGAAIFIVCFNSKSDTIKLLDGVIPLEKAEKNLISKILSEAQKAFKFPFDKQLELIDSPVFGAQQLIENTIEELLINLLRLKLNESSDIKIVMNSFELENNLVNDIIAILKEHTYGTIKLEDICKKMFYSKTYLNNIFKKNTGASIMHFYTSLKIKESKKLIRDGLSVSEISNKLYFDSPNYFSKVFKKYTGKTPSEYKRGIDNLQLL
jgi:AraC-like DNA-binding protein